MDEPFLTVHLKQNWKWKIFVEIIFMPKKKKRKQRVTALNKWITRRAYQLVHLLLMNKEKGNHSLFAVHVEVTN